MTTTLIKDLRYKGRLEEEQTKTPSFGHWLRSKGRNVLEFQDNLKVLICSPFL